MATDVGIKVQVDGEKTFKTSLQAINQQIKELNAEMKSATAGMSSMTSSEERVAAESKSLSAVIDKQKEKVSVLSQQYDTAKQRLDQLGQELQDAKNKGGDNTAEVQKAENAYNRQAAEVAKLGTQLANTNAQIKESEAKLKELGSTASTSAQKLKAAGEKMKAVGNTLKDVGSSMSKLGQNLTRYVTTSVIAAGTAAVKMASDYEENLNKVDASFQDNADEVKAWAKTATKQFGMSESAALEVTSQFGDMGTSMGLTTKEAATMATSLAGLAGDLASFKNISTDQAMNALNGIFTGQTKSLQQLGVVMKEANLKQFASDMGLVYSSMSDAEKITLRYQYVMEHTTNAQGDYARTADGTANSIRTLKASVENLGAAFGEQLLPAITPIINKITEAVNKFGELSTEEKDHVIKLGMIAAATGPALNALGKLTSGIGTLAIKGGEVATALASGGGLTGALSALGTGGVAGIAIAGLAALTVGGIALGKAIDDAIDPVKQLEKALKGMQETQDSIAQKNEIIDLANQYEDLRKKSQDTTLSQEEQAQVAEELQGVLQQLSEATDGAVTATDNLTEATDAQVAKVKELSKTERERLQLNLYSQLLDSADEYSEALLDQARLTKDVADETDHLKKFQENVAGGWADEIKSIQSVIDDTRQKLADGIIDPNTTEGAEELNSILRDLEERSYHLDGQKVRFYGIETAAAHFDQLNYSVDDATKTFIEQESSLSALEDEYKNADDIITAYRNTLLAWVKGGGSATEAANLLGVSVEGLNRMLLAYDQETVRTMAANGEFASSAEEVEEVVEEEADALDEAAEAAKETKRAIVDIALSAVDARVNGDNLRESYNDLSRQLDDLRDSGDAADIMFAEQKLHLLDLAATNEELSTSAKKMGIQVGDSLTYLSSFLISAGVSADDYASGVASMRDSVVNSFKTIRDENALTASEMTQVLRDNLEVQRNWGNNLRILWQQAEDDTVRAYINYLYQQGPQYAAAIEEFANGGYDELVAQAYLWSEAGQLSADQYAAGIWMNEYLAGNAAGDVADSALDEFDIYGDAKDEGRDAGKGFTRGLDSVDGSPSGSDLAASATSGMKSQQAEMKQAAQMLAKGAVDIMKVVAPQFRAAGVTLGANLVSGYNSQLSGSRSAAQSMASTMVTSARGVAGQFRSAGIALGQQMVAGMTSTASSFRSAGVAAGSYYTAGLSAQAGSARSAAWQLASGTASIAGSLVSSFRNAGYNSGAGFSSGVKSAAGAARSAGVSVAKNALGSMQISGWYSVGYNMSAGVARGVRGGSSLISNAAYSAAKTALVYAKKALGIRSPSTVFRDEVGLMIGEGMAEGILASEKTVAAATNALGLSAVNSINSNMMMGAGSGSVRNSTYNLTPTIYVYGAEGQNVDEIAAAVEAKINNSLIRRL